MTEKNKLHNLLQSSYLYIGGAILIYMMLMLPQYSNYSCNYDFFYYLGRAKKAIAYPLSIFQPDYALRFHPIYFLFTSLTYRVFGLSTLGHGSLNVITHVLNSLLLFNLLRQTGLSKAPATLCLVFFLVLSSQWGVISDIASLIRLGAALFFLSAMVSFVAFLKTGKKTFLIYSLMFFIISFGFNEDAISLPPLLLAMIFLVAPEKMSVWKRLFYTAPFFVLVFLYILLSAHIGSLQSARLGIGSHVPLRLLSMIKEFVHALFIPRPEFVAPLGRVPRIAIRLFPIFLIALFVFVVLKLRERYLTEDSAAFLLDWKILIFAIAWLIITGLPYSTRPTGWVWQNRYLYIPGIGASIICGTLAWNLWLSLKLLPEGYPKIKRYILLFALFTTFSYALTLNIATSIFMSYKARSEVDAATKEEVPVAFSFVNELREIYPAFPQNSILVIETLPIQPERLKKILVTYYGSLPSAIVDAQNRDKLRILLQSRRENIIYLKWQDNRLLRMPNQSLS